MRTGAIKRVLLISPPGKITVTAEGSRERKLAVPPLGLASLAARLLQEDYQVEILDVMMEGYDNELVNGPTILYGLSDEEVAARIKAFKPDAVGVSCLFSNRGREALNLCRIARESAPDALIVFGGQHPSGMPRLVMDPNVDFIMKGEADNTFPLLLRCISEGGDPRQIPQVVMKDGDSYWVSPVNDYPISRTMPLPAWELVDLERYWQAGLADYEVNKAGYKRFLIMITSRGCPHDCSFCTAPFMSDRQYRRKEINDVIDEIRIYRERYGINEVHFWDDNFFINKKRVKELVPALGRAFPDMTFQVPSGSEINALDNEVIDMLAEANFTKLFMAVESANPEIQAEMIEKRVKLDRIPALLTRLRERGIISEGSFMVGFPGETKAQIDHTFHMAATFGFDRISISIVNPLPGTPLYDLCVEKGLLHDDFDPQNIRWSSENIKMPEVERGYISSRRREVWQEYMKDRIDIAKYETQNIMTVYDRDK